MFPKIVNPLNIVLTQPIRKVLEEIFADYQQVIIRAEYGYGQSGSRVFEIRPVKLDGAELPTIIKIAHTTAIRQEWLAYQSCIENKLPMIAKIEGGPVYPPGNPLGGLRYALAGDGVFGVISLYEYCQRTAIENIKITLAQLFTAMNMLWKQNAVKPDLFLKTTYDSFLPANLIIERIESEFLPSNQPTWLSPATAQQKNWVIGDTVQFAGFTPIEVDLEAGRILLDSLDADNAFRFYLTGVSETTMFDVGRSIDEPIIGTIHETRHSLLTKRVEALFPSGTDVSARTLSIGHYPQLPNPLTTYRNILNRAYDTRVACIHGDFHGHNILIEEKSGRPHLIDFGKSHRDYVLRDLIQLEVNLLTALFPIVLTDPDKIPTSVHNFYTQLHCSVVNADNIMPPEYFSRPFIILRQLRETARSYLFHDNNWQEYYDGLSLHLLGSLKFQSLDGIACQILFWAAATIMQLRETPPDCHPANALDKQDSLSEKANSSETLEPSFMPPKTYQRLIGRVEEQNKIMVALRAPKIPPIVVIVGLGGMGKTALAREIVVLCQQEGLFDHIVWTSAKAEHFIGERAVEQGARFFDLDALLSDIGRQCDRIDIATMPTEQKKAAVAYLLAQQSIMVVMDNLETVLEHDAIVRHMVDIIGKGKLLITSRHRITHERAFTVELKGFPVEDGIVFLRTEGQERNIMPVVNASQESLLEIHTVAGGAPLALRLVVGQLSRQPLISVLQSLRQASAKGQDYEFYRFVYWHSWNLLGETSQMALVDLSVFPPIVGGAIMDVEAVSQLQTDTFWSAMDQLVTMSLADKTGSLGQERFALHPLTHYFILADITEEWSETNG